MVHSVQEIAEKATECPFMHQGCPFDPAQPHSFDVNLFKKCPAFKEGCPYKDTHLEKLKDCPAFKDHKCPFDGSHTVDFSKISQCPAFKNGCPYVHVHSKKKIEHENMNEHAATEHIAEKASKCPFFHGGGCPFDPNHPHSFDLSKIKECPAFQNGGCPFKHVHTEKLRECPAFKDGKCPFDGAKSIDLSKVKECPAFKSGCPYSKLHKHDAHHHSNMNEHMATEHIASQSAKCPFFSQAHGGCPFDPNHPHAFDLSKVKECPAFKGGECPFKHVHTERLKECPAFKDGKCPFSDGSAKIDLSRVHECPAFKKGCPYSNLAGHSETSDKSTPLLSSTDSAGTYNATTTTTTTTTTATTTPTAPPTTPSDNRDPAKCPFAHMHGKVDNPHK